MATGQASGIGPLIVSRLFALVLALSNSATGLILQSQVDGHLKIFKNLEEMRPDSAYFHVPVQLDQFQNLLTNAKSLLDNNTKKVFSNKAFQDKCYYDGNIERTHEILICPNSNWGDADVVGISVYHRLEEMLAHFNNITNMLLQVQDKHH